MLTFTEAANGWRIVEAAEDEALLKLVESDADAVVSRIAVKLIPSQTLLVREADRVYFEFGLSRKYDVVQNIETTRDDVRLSLVVGGTELTEVSDAVLPLMSLMYQTVCVRVSFPSSWKREDEGEGVPLEFSALLLKSDIRRTLMQSHLKLPTLECANGCLVLDSVKRPPVDRKADIKLVEYQHLRESAAHTSSKDLCEQLRDAGSRPVTR
jgi:hypothetical protein